jgi:hypothetical protein
MSEAIKMKKRSSHKDFTGKQLLKQEKVFDSASLE